VTAWCKYYISIHEGQWPNPNHCETTLACSIYSSRKGDGHIQIILSITWWMIQILCIHEWPHPDHCGCIWCMVLIFSIIWWCSHQIIIRVTLGLCLSHFQQYFSFIVEVSFKSLIYYHIMLYRVPRHERDSNS